MTLFDQVGDLKDQEDSDQRHTGQRNQEANDALRQCEFGLGQLLVTVLVDQFITLVDFVEQIVVGLQLKEEVNQVGNEEDDGGGPRDLQHFTADLIDAEIEVCPAIQGVVVDSRKNQAHCNEGQQPVGQ